MFISSAKSASEVSESREYSLDAALLVSNMGHVLVLISVLHGFHSVMSVYQETLISIVISLN